MKKSERKTKKLPERFKTLREAGDFWDKHDLSDYWDETRRVHFDVEVKTERNYYALEKEISERIEKLAGFKGISPETLVNLLLKEKVSVLQK